jgi:hypothetical protein
MLAFDASARFPNRSGSYYFNPGTRVRMCSEGTVKSSVTSRDPHIGQRRRLSRRDSGKPLAPRPYERLHIQLGSVDAFLVPVHAVLLAGRAPRGDAPAVGQGFSKGLDRRWDISGTPPSVSRYNIHTFQEAEFGGRNSHSLKSL